MSAINAINLSRFFLYFIPQDPDPWTQMNADPDPHLCIKEIQPFARRQHFVDFFVVNPPPPINNKI